MSMINKLWVRLFSQKIGSDQFGNEYYVGSKKNYLGRNNRYVIYKGADEASKVPPLWHAWLHHLSNHIPLENKEYEWQAVHLPNLSGTKHAYKFCQAQSANKNLYSSWIPK